MHVTKFPEIKKRAESHGSTLTTVPSRKEMAMKEIVSQSRDPLIDDTFTYSVNPMPTRRNEGKVQTCTVYFRSLPASHVT